jgi:hypothetical protein
MDYLEFTTWRVPLKIFFADINAKVPVAIKPVGIRTVYL